MWNEARNKAPAAASEIVARALGQGWQESPLVGASALLKAHQASPSKAFRLAERPFRDLVNLRGDAADPAFLAAVESVHTATEHGRTSFTQVETGVADAESWTTAIAESASAGSALAAEITSRLVHARRVQCGEFIAFYDPKQ